ECAQTLIHKRLHDAGNIGVQLAFRLTFELRLRQLYADHRDQSLADIVAREILLQVLKQSELLPGVVDGASKRRAEARQMRAAIDGVDVVGERKNRFRVGVVILQG